MSARRRVLVVDDNGDTRQALQLLLGREGFEVRGARDGTGALDLQRRHPSDLLITDLLMPNKDGLETIEDFRREFPAVRIIAMSGGGVRISGERYLTVAEVAGADAVLRKPFDPHEMIATVRRLLAAPGP